MARPRRSEKSKQELIAIGALDLAENGFNGTGLKQLLDQAGVPKGSFYNYFDSKEHFAAEIVRHYNQLLLDLLMARAAEPDISPLSALRQAYEDLIALTESRDCRQNCLLGSLAAEIAATSDLCRQAISDAYGAWHLRVTEMLVYAQAGHEIRRDLPAADLADMFWNAWQGAQIRMLIDRNTAPLKQTLDMVLDHLFRPQNPTAEPAGQNGATP